MVAVLKLLSVFTLLSVIGIIIYRKEPKPEHKEINNVVAAFTVMCLAATLIMLIIAILIY